MNVLIVTNSCEVEKYKQIEEGRTRSVLGAQQKFFNFLIRGLAENSELKIDVLTILPVSASSHKKRFWKTERHYSAENLKYHYMGFVNGKISRFLSQFFVAKWFIYNWAKNKSYDDTIIICDPLIAHVTMPIQKEAKKRGLKTMGVVTDIPCFVTDVLKSKFGRLKYFLQNSYDLLTEKNICKYDSYVLLTQNMNKLVNPLHKPYMILEGIADSNIQITEQSSKKKICMYAGGIFKKFGVLKLADAFSKTNLIGWELHIYGTGNDVSELKEVCKKDKSIKYKGTIPQSEIVNVESEALLLVNPRPSAEEFTSYSFPSKTTEYMSSGTAVLSTRLPGIPKEYEPFLFWFDGEDVESIANKLEEICKKSDAELIEFGSKGRSFIIENKGFIPQGLRLLNFIYEVLQEQGRDETIKK